MIFAISPEFALNYAGGMMLLMLLGSFFACSNPNGQICTEIFSFSVQMELLDEEGMPINDADISYTVDGIEGELVEGWGEGFYVIGGEETGLFDISIDVRRSDQEDDCCEILGFTDIQLFVPADECHVISQSISPVLEWQRLCSDAVSCDE